MLPESTRISQRFKITESLYGGFVELFGDRNPLHTDEVFATSLGFSGRVMHGNILNGFLSFCIGECLPTKKVIIHSQEIQFKNPVYLNDELVLVAEVVGVYESVKAVEFKFRFENQREVVVAKGKIQIGLL